MDPKIGSPGQLPAANGGAGDHGAASDDEKKKGVSEGDKRTTGAAAGGAAVPDMKPIKVEEFETIMGIRITTNSMDADHHTQDSEDYSYPSWWSLCLPSVGRHPEREGSIYYTLIDEERHARFYFRAVDVLVYACMIFQLAIASALIILGATEGDHHLAVAVLGAVTGVTTGVLGLIKGQGQPMRALAYADSLRALRDDVEWARKELQAGAGQDFRLDFARVQALKDRYDRVRKEKRANRPDVWTSFAQVEDDAKRKLAARGGK